MTVGRDRRERAVGRDTKVFEFVKSTLKVAKMKMKMIMIMIMIMITHTDNSLP